MSFLTLSESLLPASPRHGECKCSNPFWVCCFAQGDWCPAGIPEHSPGGLDQWHLLYSLLDMVKCSTDMHTWVMPEATLLNRQLRVSHPASHSLGAWFKHGPQTPWSLWRNLSSCFECQRIHVIVLEGSQSAWLSLWFHVLCFNTGCLWPTLANPLRVYVVQQCYNYLGGQFWEPLRCFCLQVHLRLILIQGFKVIFFRLPPPC